VRDVDHAFATVSENFASLSVVCFECGGLGHYKKDCPNLIGLKSQKTSGGNGNKTGGNGGVKKYQPASSRSIFRTNNPPIRSIDGQLVKSIMRKATVPQSSFPLSAVRRIGVYIDYDQQFEEANMMEEIMMDEIMMEKIIVDELLGDRVEVAFAAGVGPHLVCIDSGANIFILNFLIGTLINYVQNLENRQIRTAAMGGVLRIEVMFDAGAALRIRYCPEATASLMPTYIICLCNFRHNRWNHALSHRWQKILSWRF
jgi:hypothetical protein